jgi:hypothetical protein
MNSQANTALTQKSLTLSSTTTSNTAGLNRQTDDADEKEEED